jgi:hypothetical protein
MSQLVLNSYVGIISRRGLESLLPDGEHAAPFLVRRACRRQPTEAICYWAVMQDTAAKEVERQLQWQLYENALATLHECAKHFGTFLPPEFEDTG